MEEIKKDKKILRIALLKKQYASMIMKSQQQLLDKAFDAQEMKKEVELHEKQLQEEKAKSWERDREATRIAIASIKRTVNFDDGLQAERDFLAIINAPQQVLGNTFDDAPQQILGNTFDEREMKQKVELQLQEEKAKSQNRDREAARMAIASIKRTVNFGDDLQAESDFLAIIGAPQPILDGTLDEKEMKKKVDLWEKQLILQEEKVKQQQKKDREAARNAIASIKRTVNFGDGLQAEGEFLAIIGAPNCW